MKGCCHFTGGEQKYEACKACAKPALMGCAVAIRKNGQQQEVTQICLPPE